MSAAGRLIALGMCVAENDSGDGTSTSVTLPNPPRRWSVYFRMPGLLVFAFFATLLVLRLARPPGRCLPGGIALMGFGVWLLLDATSHSTLAGSLEQPPHLFVLMLGLWCVIKGALRMAER